MNYPQLLTGLFIGLFCGLIESSATAADLAKETVKSPVQACIIAAGDLNDDQLEDYAVSWPVRPAGGASSVYIVYGDGTPLAGGSDEVTLRQRAAMILHGPAAAPFRCAAALHSAAARLPAAAKKTGPSTTLVGPLLQYRMVLLDPGPFSGYFYAHAIAPHGEVVGQCYNAQWQQRACLSDENGVHDLGTLGGHFSVAYDINASGQVVGYSLTGATEPMGWVHQAFLSDGDGVPMQSLGESWSSAEALNDKAQVVGAMKVASGFQHAALFDAGSVIDLGALDGPYSFAYGINNPGQIVGTADTYNATTGQSATHSILYDQGVLYDLGSLGYFCSSFDAEGELKIDCYEQSSASDINDRGQIVGYSTTEQGATHAYLMNNGIAADLGTLGGLQSWAMAINDSGQVVGTSLTSNDAAYSAFLYDRGAMYDLNQLIVEPFPHPSLSTAQDINDFGQIAAQNYRLDPIYTSIAADREFVFNATLGRQFDFAYWLDTEEVGTCSGTKRIQVLVKIELNGLTPNELDKGSHILSRWQPVDAVRGSCADTDTWLNATRPLPAVVQGKAATISIRTRTFDKSWNPTLYLRHFAMQ